MSSYLTFSPAKLSQPEQIDKDDQVEEATRNFQNQQVHNEHDGSADSDGINIDVRSSPNIFNPMRDEPDEADLDGSGVQPTPDRSHIQKLVDEATRGIDDLADALEALDPDSLTFSITFRALRDQRRLRKSERSALINQLNSSALTAGKQSHSTAAAVMTTTAPTAGSNGFNKSNQWPSPRDPTPQKPNPQQATPQPVPKAPVTMEQPPKMPSPPPCPFNPDSFDEDDIADIPSEAFDYPFDDSPARPAHLPAAYTASPVQSSSLFTTASKVLSTRHSDLNSFPNPKASMPSFSHVIDMTGDDDDIDDDGMPAYNRPANKQAFVQSATKVTPNRTALSSHPEFSYRDGYPHSKELTKGLKSVSQPNMAHLFFHTIRSGFWLEGVSTASAGSMQRRFIKFVNRI